MKVYIELRGCDDITGFIEDINETELSFLNRIAKKAAKTSTYGCMPDINYYIIEEENWNKYIKWKDLDAISEERELNHKEKEFYSQYYNQNWLIETASEKFNAYEYSKLFDF